MSTKSSRPETWENLGGVKEDICPTVTLPTGEGRRSSCLQPWRTPPFPLASMSLPRRRMVVSYLAVSKLGLHQEDRRDQKAWLELWEIITAGCCGEWRRERAIAPHAEETPLHPNVRGERDGF